VTAPPTTAADVIKAAMAVAKDAAEGQLQPDALDADLVSQCRALFGTVVSRADPLWPLQCDVAREVLAAGLSLAECCEWVAVLEQRQDAQQAQNGQQAP